MLSSVLSGGLARLSNGRRFRWPVSPTGTGPAATANQDGASTAAGGAYRAISLEQLEKEHILATLAAFKNNKSRAAIVLGVERSTLDRKLKKYEGQE